MVVFVNFFIDIIERMGLDEEFVKMVRRFVDKFFNLGGIERRRTWVWRLMSKCWF